MRSALLACIVCLAVVNACAPHSPKRGGTATPRPTTTNGNKPGCPAVKHFPVNGCAPLQLKNCYPATITATSATCSKPNSHSYVIFNDGRSSLAVYATLQCRGTDWWMSARGMSVNLNEGPDANKAQIVCYEA